MINKRLHMENPTEMCVPGNCRLLNSNLRPLDHGFFGVELGLSGLCHADKKVRHFRRAAQKPGYADHDQNARVERRPDERQRVSLGHIVIDQVGPNSPAADRSLAFQAGTLPPGIEIADPMLTIRNASYFDLK